MVPLRLVAIATSGLLAFGCTFQFAEEKEYEQSFDLKGATKLVIFGMEGDVSIEGGNVAKAEIRGSAFAVGNNKKEARDNLKYASLDPSYDDNALSLKFDPPFEMSGLVGLDLDGGSLVPRGIDIEVSTSSGDISVKRAAGNLKLDTGGGDISLELEAGVGFRVVCHAGEGRVFVDGDLQAIRSDEDDGTVEVRIGDASSEADLDSGGGDIRIFAISGD